MNNTSFRQLVNLGKNIRKLLRRTFIIFDRFKIADGITGGFTVIFVSIPAFFRLTDIFLGSLGDLPLSLKNFKTAKVRRFWTKQKEKFMGFLKKTTHRGRRCLNDSVCPHFALTTPPK